MLPPAFELRARVALAITDVLRLHGIDEHVTWEDFAVTHDVVTDGFGPGQKISSAIVNKVWPSVRQAEVYHYTSRKAAESILSSRIFRLTNIGKRISDGEIQTFCETHGLSGYLATTNGQPEYRSLIEPNTYYASFTATTIDETEERSFWQAFGPVRLRLSVEAQNPDFRHVYYEQTSGEAIPVLGALSERIRTDFTRKWILAGVSRICSFYLDRASYGWEKELRMLWRVWDGSPCQSVGTGPDSYVEIPLDAMSPCGFRLTVTQVCAEEQLSVPSGAEFVRRTR